MKRVKQISAVLFALFMIYGGVNHFLHPEFYDAFIPDFLPKLAVNYVSGLIEVLLGVGLFLPAFKQRAAWGLFFLMIAFLPLHIWDLFRENPAIGSQTAAIIRVPIQFLLIAWTWWLTRETTE